MRLWCQLVDRCARRLQHWFRQRLLRRRLEQTAALLRLEADRLQARYLRKADTPPPAPSKWTTQQPLPTSLATSDTSHLPSVSCAQSASPSHPEPATFPVVFGPSRSATPRSQKIDSSLAPRASLACPPPLRKPQKPRIHSTERTCDQPSVFSSGRRPPFFAPERTAYARELVPDQKATLRPHTLSPGLKAGGEDGLRCALPRLRRLPPHLQPGRACRSLSSSRRALDAAF